MSYIVEIIPRAAYITQLFNYWVANKDNSQVHTNAHDLIDETKEELAQRRNKGWLHGLLWRSIPTMEVDREEPNKFIFNYGSSCPPLRALESVTEELNPNALFNSVRILNNGEVYAHFIHHQQPA